MRLWVQLSLGHVWEFWDSELGQVVSVVWIPAGQDVHAHLVVVRACFGWLFRILGML